MTPEFHIDMNILATGHFYLPSDMGGMDLLKSFMLSNSLIEASKKSLII